MKITPILAALISFISLVSFATEDDIIKAAKAGDTVRVKALLETNPELVKMTDDGIGATALHWAAMYGRKDVVRVILTYKPDANTEEAHGGTTMHWAAHYDDAEVIGWLLDCGAAIDHKNRYRRTPLLVAARRGCKDVVETLIERGADINATTGDGSTALHIAATNGHWNVVELLLEKGTDESIKNDRNETYKDVLFTRPETTTINTDLLDDYAGLYERQEGQTIDIRKENNGLIYYAFGKDELQPISESCFIMHAEVGYFTFLRNNEGKVTELIYKIGDREYRAKKLK
jgi:ankyrin repeat protein